VTHRARRGRAVSRASSPKPQFVPAAARARARGRSAGNVVRGVGRRGNGGWGKGSAGLLWRGSCGGARPRPRGGIRDSEGASAEPRHLFLDGGGERDAGCEHRFRWHVFRPLAAQPPSPAQPSSDSLPSRRLRQAHPNPPTDSLPGEHRQPPWRTPTASLENTDSLPGEPTLTPRTPSPPPIVARLGRGARRGRCPATFRARAFRPRQAGSGRVRAARP
jgi:hypothetical protein